MIKLQHSGLGIHSNFRPLPWKQWFFEFFKDYTRLYFFQLPPKIKQSVQSKIVMEKIIKPQHFWSHQPSAFDNICLSFHAAAFQAKSSWHLIAFIFLAMYWMFSYGVRGEIWGIKGDSCGNERKRIRQRGQEWGLESVFLLELQPQCQRDIWEWEK